MSMIAQYNIIMPVADVDTNVITVQLWKFCEI